MSPYLIILGILLLAVPSQAGEMMRVLINDDQQVVNVRPNGELVSFNARGELIEAAMGGGPLTITPSDEGLVVNGRPVGDQPLHLTSMSCEVFVNDVKVYGDIDIRMKPSGMLRTVARLDMQDYLKGVVPAEASPKWELEVLKAQAVAARTFALYRKKTKNPDDFDVTADVNSQVYKGNGGGSSVSDRAVDETDGLVITYNGKLINAMFHSCCGGQTEDIEEVFGRPVEYLKPAEGQCPLDSPKMRWERWFSPDELRQALTKAGYSLGRIKGVEIARLSSSKRASKLLVRHSKGNLILKGNDFRRVMGWEVVPSTRFTLKKVRDRYYLKGSGSGHGIGLCQWGAKEMAVQGKSFEEILHHYYKDVKIEPYRPDM